MLDGNCVTLPNQKTGFVEYNKILTAFHL
uniref:Uncharacterized protein n=1 Tax=Anguilla anguilla TaxID=7936 RepID=A0A0E9TPA9_ANGAN